MMSFVQLCKAFVPRLSSAPLSSLRRRKIHLHSVRNRQKPSVPTLVDLFYYARDAGSVHLIVLDTVWQVKRDGNLRGIVEVLP
jgi:hypothetical protein